MKTPIAGKGRVELVIDNRRVHAAPRAVAEIEANDRDQVGDSWVAKTISSPLSMNTGASLRVPSVVRRTGSSRAAAHCHVRECDQDRQMRVDGSSDGMARSEQFMHDTSFGQHAKLGAGGGVDAGQLEDGRSDHGRGDRVADGMFAAGVALADGAARLNAAAGPEREITGDASGRASRSR